MAVKKKSVASVSSHGGVTIGASSVIRWNDNMDVQGYAISVKKAVLLGKKNGLEIAKKLEKDLKSKTGLLITFPIAMLMDQLQKKVGSGEALLKLVKP